MNRLLTWTTEGIERECDPRHAQIVIRELGVANAGAKITTPGIKEIPEEAESECQPLPLDQVSWYRSLCMRVAYMAQGRVDLGVIIRELAKGMKTPTVRHVEKLKRAARFLIGHPRLVQRFRNQEAAINLQGWCDADYAGCLRTRKNTSGGAIMLGDHCVSHWCRGQAVIGLSSGEAEDCSLVTLMSELIGLRLFGEDSNFKYALGVNIDATAATGMSGRRGLGEVNKRQYVERERGI